MRLLHKIKNISLAINYNSSIYYNRKQLQKHIFLAKRYFKRITKKCKKNVLYFKSKIIFKLEEKIKLKARFQIKYKQFLTKIFWTSIFTLLIF